ncbi:MAG TPA: hypothetical protein VFB14_17290 [Bryobacteraceae bacterium]|jgi:hypothetical protein|nr:hypothetical protein [Bryobacteraceae bacterium]
MGRISEALTVLRRDLETARRNGWRLTPVPFVEWRVHSLLGRLRLQRGDGTADEAFEKASRIVQSIAANIEDEKLRASFLGSRAVRELKHC